MDILGDVVESYFDIMGEHIQFNVASAETLIAAQKKSGRICKSNGKGSWLLSILYRTRQRCTGQYY